MKQGLDCFDWKGFDYLLKSANKEQLMIMKNMIEVKQW